MLGRYWKYFRCQNGLITRILWRQLILTVMNIFAGFASNMVKALSMKRGQDRQQRIDSSNIIWNLKHKWSFSQWH